VRTIRKAGAWFFFIGMFGLPKVAQGVWELTAPTDPSRSWSVNLSTGIGYDDNVNTTSTKKQGSLTGNVEPQLLVSMPRERTTLGLRYTYDATYYSQRVGSSIVESHVADATLAWRITPRLNASFSDSVRRGLDPGLVERQPTVGGPPQVIIVQQRGDYLYNSTNARLSYDLTRRWTVSISGGWDLWSYDVAAVATNNNLNSYNTLLSADYLVDPRTYVGANYQYSTAQYDNPGPGNARNSEGQAGYISFVRQFNPQLSGQLNAGVELRTFGTGTNSTAQTAPTFSASLVYNYGPENSLIGAISYDLSTTEVGAYRSTDSLSVSLQAHHQFTRKLQLTVNGAYIQSTFQNPTPGFFVIDPHTGLPAPPASGLVEDAFQGNLSLYYSFQTWIAADLSYTYDTVTSQLQGRSFDRNRVGITLRLKY
jgi:Putative beta-barrel porin 2